MSPFDISNNLNFGEKKERIYKTQVLIFYKYKIFLKVKLIIHYFNVLQILSHDLKRVPEGLTA